MNECPQCETVWENGRFCPDCLYHLPGPSIRERLRRWLHRAALTAGELGRRETERCRVAPGVRLHGTAVPRESSASPAVSVVVPPSDGES